MSSDASSNNIAIKNLEGKTIMLHGVEPTDTGLAVKTLYAEKQGVPINEQRLVHGGREIEDDKALAEYGVKANSTLYLVLKLRGGYVHPVGSLPTGAEDVSESLF